jgi:hypothetical protein
MEMLRMLMQPLKEGRQHLPMQQQGGRKQAVMMSRRHPQKQRRLQ